MVPQDLHFVHNAKALTFIGQKKIEAMLVETAEEGVGWFWWTASRKGGVKMQAEHKQGKEMR